MRISNSRIKSFLSCPRRYYWTYVKNLSPVSISIPLVFGRSIHRALAEWYANFSQPVTLEIFEATMRDAIKDVEWFKEEKDKYQLHINAGIELLKQYFERYKKEPFSVLQSELKFEVPLDSHTLVGRTDAIINWDGRFKLLEHKTTSKLGQNYLNKFNLDSQLTSYIYGIRKALKIDIQEVVLNCLRKIRIDAKKSEPEFVRDIIIRADEDLEIFEKEVVLIAAQIESCEQNPELFWRNTDSCIQYGTCAYHSLCMHGEDEAILSEYKERKWED